jgi:hypothetical protein
LLLATPRKLHSPWGTRGYQFGKHCVEEEEEEEEEEATK